MLTKAQSEIKKLPYGTGYGSLNYTITDYDISTLVNLKQSEYNERTVLLYYFFIPSAVIINFWHKNVHEF